MVKITRTKGKTVIWREKKKETRNTNNALQNSTQKTKANPTINQFSTIS
jgi:hypothetical protein